MKALITDVAVSAVLTSITGAVIALVMGMARKTIAVA
jgi:hypothetical protein